MTTRPVVIVGAGATGSTLALLLARYGVPSTVLERRSDPLLHPAAHVINARSLEIWQHTDPSLAARIAALAPPIEQVSIIRWCGDPAGPPLGQIDLLSRPDWTAQVRSHSPFLLSHIGQHQLMPVLWEALDREPLVDFRRATIAEQVDQTGSRAVVTARSAGPASSVETMYARFAVAADGANSRLREQAGIGMDGPVLANMGSVFFHAPGLFPAGTERPLLSWIYRPGFCGVMIAHADDDYILMTVYLHPAQQIARESRAYWERMLPAVLGPGVSARIRSTGTWTMTSQMASRFRCGALLLAGDAAHRFPHTGGFGLNSGVQDAHNLAWKLTAIFHDGAHENLLDTYDIERRPVVARFAEQSVSNHFLLDKVTRPLGVTNRAVQQATAALARPPLAWLPDRLLAPVCDRLTDVQTARTAVVAPGHRRAGRVRARIAAQIPGQLEHFIATGLEFGYIYRSPLIRSEPGPVPVDGDGVLTYRPTTWPGARLPHAMIDLEREPVPIHDSLGPGRLTVFTADPRAWIAALTTDSRPPLPIQVIALRAPDPHDRDAMMALYEVGEHGAVAVRPDGHVLWRSRDQAATAAPELLDWLRTRWGPYWPAGNDQPRGRGRPHLVPTGDEQTVEGSPERITSRVQRIRQLTSQAADDLLTVADTEDPARDR
ncbi:FAD-dependent monooxygenase [Nocardia asiatica]|uniref:FAD-dependent monooxygenase n=1 Tax=Nocardia asiatica TaxID=209252 RepID=UPI002455B715|nr:FAD-dependent monooxygenase [Nocardia asiatica]